MIRYVLPNTIAFANAFVLLAAFNRLSGVYLKAEGLSSVERIKRANNECLAVA